MKLPDDHNARMDGTSIQWSVAHRPLINTIVFTWVGAVVVFDR